NSQVMKKENRKEKNDNGVKSDVIKKRFKEDEKPERLLKAQDIIGSET
ncbi:4343_t:CDS:1, partial [Funneliformis caledonium]